MSTTRAELRWFGPLVAATVLTNAVYSIVRVNTSYRALALGGDATAVGVIAGAFALVPLLIALPVGRAVDRYRTGPAIVAGTVLTAAGAGLTAVSSDLLLLGAGNVVLGLGQLLFTVSGQAVIAKLSTTAELDRRFGGLTFGVSLGQAVGLPLGGAVTAATRGPGGELNTTPGLLVATALAVLALPLVAVLRTPPPAPVRRAQRQSSWRMLRTPGMKPAMYSSLAVLSATDVLTAYLPVFGEHHGIGVGVVTALLTARTITSVLSRLLLGRLVALVDRRLLLVSAPLCSAIALAVVPLVPVPWVLLVCLAVAGFFMGLGQPLTMTWVVRLVSDQNRGSALSLRLSGNRLGQVAVPYLAGALAGVTGIGAVFGLTAGMLGVAAGITATTRAHLPS
ncbi:MFS transporter [Saccharopolyspora sp. CA-218241]|uniref:MFS transporter n=1 Tax=Saccharopolyspora sp. CA-218241 TaxID=3240027 RepID=UPI003D975AB9